MSQENMDVVVRAVQLTGSDEFLSVCHPEIEWDMTRLMPEPRVYHGHDGVREFWRSWAGTWAGLEVAMEQAIDAGGEEVVVEIRNTGRGRGSGAAVELRFGQVWTVRDRQVVRLRAFPSLEAALEAVGLSE
jgi:ketosteroid isomerase-like protein